MAGTRPMRRVARAAPFPARVRGSPLAEPRDRARDALVERHLRLPAEQVARLADVGDVARHLPDERRRIERTHAGGHVARVATAGGVRDLEGVKAMIAAGATRVGASAGVKIVQQARGEKTLAAPPSGY